MCVSENDGKTDPPLMEYLARVKLLEQEVPVQVRGRGCSPEEGVLPSEGRW